MKHNLNIYTVLKYAVLLGTISALASGCFWGHWDHDRDEHRDHDRFDAPRHEEEHHEDREHHD